MSIAVVVNRGGGSSRPDIETLLRDAFAGHDLSPAIHVVAPGDLAGVCAEASKADDCLILVAAGGDGTIGTAAAALAGTGRALGIVPLGTLNHFARDAGIPLDLEGAVAVIAAGHRRRIDVAEVSGRVFVNNSAVGLYPEMVRFRHEAQARTGLGKRLAMLAASLRALRSFHRRRLLVTSAGSSLPLTTPLLLVGNNRYRMDLFALGHREALDRGEICLYAVGARTRLHLLWAAVRGLFGRLDQQRDFLTLCGEAIDIASERPALTLSVDGETVTMRTPLRYRVRPGALTIIAPE